MNLLRPVEPVSLRTARGLVGYLAALLATALVTALCWRLHGGQDQRLVLVIYQVTVVLIALRWGHGASAFACLLSVVAFDFYFEAPAYSFRVADWGNLLTFAGMLLVAQLVARLVERFRRELAEAAARTSELETLHALGRALAAATTAGEVAEAVARQLRVDLRVEAELRLGAEQAWDEGVLPVAGPRGALAGLALPPVPGREALLNALCALTALALDRIRLVEEAQRSSLDAETERLRSSVLSAVSHDLRTPLAAIHGAVSGLLLVDGELPAAQRREILAMVLTESDRLGHFLANLLEMTRLESGALEVQKEWQPLEEVVGAALSRLESRRGALPVELALRPGLPLVPLDGILVEQVLLNLLENALRYAGPQPVRLSAWVEGAAAVVEVADRGPGIPEAERERVFEKFVRPLGRRGDGGAGLGLAICRGLVQAHGGRIWVEPREGGGSAFRFSLPLEGAPPTLPREPEELT